MRRTSVFHCVADDFWYEGFAVPWIAEVAPDTLNYAKPSGILPVGAVASVLLFAGGWVLVGIASIQARLVPLGISLAIVLGGLVGVLVLMPPFGAPLGLALTALGVWLLLPR